MKKLVLTSLLTVFAVSGAQASSGFYAAGHLGTSNVGGADLFDGTAVVLSLGYEFNNGIRLETEVLTSGAVTYNDSDTFEAKLPLDNSNGFGLYAVKVMYDFDMDSKFTPYLGAGLTDLGWTSNGESTGNNDKFEIGGMFIAGVTYDMSAKIRLDLQYNREFTADAILGDGSGTSSNGWDTIRFGAMYKF